MFQRERSRVIEKTLSKNDTGETGAHQAGMHVPKSTAIISFFPKLEEGVKNPRHNLTFLDEQGRPWKFVFLYYNNKFFGGTRNEYRLTHMTSYIATNNLKAGDRIVLERSDGGDYRIRANRESEPVVPAQGVLKLSGGWKVVNI